MSSVKAFLEKYERRISAAAILLGFFIDSITLVRIDFYLTNVLLVAYLLIAATAIFVINVHENGGFKKLSDPAYWWLFVAVQFSFGGLFGRFLIFYSRSGSFSASWPFLLILLLLLIGNEFAKKYYTRLLLQIDFFFLALFLFLIFFLPVTVGYMSDWLFVASGILSLVILAGFIKILTKVLPGRITQHRTNIVVSVLLIFIAVNVLYFTNVIPPIPLSLRSSGVYHSLTVSNSVYRATHEESSFFDFFTWTETVHIRPGDPVYVYSAIFAPTNFGASVAHRWEQYDEVTKKWVTAALVPFPVVGGQDRGYRGYSFKTNPAEGPWRVIIQTPRGQEIGRVSFEIKYVNSLPLLVQETL